MGKTKFDKGFIIEAINFLKNVNPTELDFNLARYKKSKLPNLKRSIKKYKSRKGIKFDQFSVKDISLLVAQHLREGQPLISSTAYDNIVSKVNIDSNPIEVVDCVLVEIQLLPKTDFIVLGKIILFLNDKSQYIDTSYLARIFAPLLIHNRKKILGDESNIITRTKIIKILIENASIFETNDECKSLEGEELKSVEGEEVKGLKGEEVKGLEGEEVKGLKGEEVKSLKGDNCIQQNHSSSSRTTKKWKDKEQNKKNKVNEIVKTTSTSVSAFNNLNSNNANLSEQLKIQSEEELPNGHENYDRTTSGNDSLDSNAPISIQTKTQGPRKQSATAKRNSKDKQVSKQASNTKKHRKGSKSTKKFGTNLRQEQSHRGLQLHMESKNKHQIKRRKSIKSCITSAFKMTTKKKDKSEVAQKNETTHSKHKSVPGKLKQVDAPSAIQNVSTATSIGQLKKDHKTINKRLKKQKSQSSHSRRFSSIMGLRRKSTKQQKDAIKLKPKRRPRSLDYNPTFVRSEHSKPLKTEPKHKEQHEQRETRLIVHPNHSQRDHRASLPSQMGAAIVNRKAENMMWPWSYAAYKKIVLAGITSVGVENPELKKRNLKKFNKKRAKSFRFNPPQNDVFQPRRLRTSKSAQSLFQQLDVDSGSNHVRNNSSGETKVLQTTFVPQFKQKHLKAYQNTFGRKPNKKGSNEQEAFHQYLKDRLAERYLEQVNIMKDILLLKQTFLAWRTFIAIHHSSKESKFVWSVNVKRWSKRTRPMESSSVNQSGTWVKY